MIKFEIVCMTDHSANGGAHPGQVLKEYERGEEAEDGFGDLLTVYPRCHIVIRSRD